MIYLHRVPAPPLDAFIASIWYCETAPGPLALQRVLPGGAAQLIVNLKEDQTRVYDREPEFCCTTASGTILVGVQSRYCIIDTAEQEHVLGVAFRPGGTTPFFRIPAHDIRDAHIPLELLWGRRRAADVREQLLAARPAQARLDVMEGALAHACKLPGPHPAVTFAIDAFAHGYVHTTVRSVTDTVGLSPKRFIERFKADVGLSPKHYCRILRFQRALARAGRGDRVDWTRIAMDCGYFDQSHFIHDFRSFSGITPSGYQSSRTEFQNHVKFLQSDINPK
ncbi:MAG TPA: helix-turn-helix domain-containing protein [Bryobacteraceae bacterium]|nr:helix-turn-helix domain-containing protein [Bryobacteraceae bacterium]